MASSEKSGGLGAFVKTALIRSYKRFVRIRGNPHEIALGFALGIFVGMSPTMGIQMAIAVFLASLLGWNKLTAAAGCWISNPVTAPFLYSMTYLTGAHFMADPPNSHLTFALNLDGLLSLLRNAPGIFWAMFLGGALLGLPLAYLGYRLSYLAVLRYREQFRATLAKEGMLLKRTGDSIRRRMRTKKIRKRGRTISRKKQRWRS
ncbi:MAG: hypothetical protein CSB33_00345 [Desulfobacterales bacterium]|nr:MAG: hypothetical protein CSB33_00345 [Desulfobacterales bacterium]